MRESSFALVLICEFVTNFNVEYVIYPSKLFIFDWVPRICLS